MRIRPASPDLKLRDPVTRRHVPAEGLEVPDASAYWLRRLEAGEVVVASPPRPVVSDSHPIPDSEETA